MKAKWKLRLAGLVFFALSCSTCTSTFALTSRRFEFLFWGLGALSILLAVVGVNLFRAAEGRLRGSSANQTVPIPCLFLLGPIAGVLAGAKYAPAMFELGVLAYLGAGAGMGLVAATAIALQGLVIEKLGVEGGFVASRQIAAKEAEND
tara:strand:- start:1158 stop:1604 length:447 start_codon:yes stop_codon:yes gene_type:complete